MRLRGEGESILGISGFPSVHVCLHDASTFELSLGWEAVPRPAAVAQVGLVGCSVRPQGARDAAVTLKRLVVSVVLEVTLQISFSQRMGDPGRQDGKGHHGEGLPGREMLW